MEEIVQQEDPTWLPERLERARKQAVRTLLDTLGVSDEETLKNQLASLEKLSQERNQAVEQGQRLVIESAFQTACHAYTFYDLHEVRTLADLSGVRVAEDGTVSGMAEAIEALVATRPHLLKRPPTPDIDSAPIPADAPLLTTPMLDTVRRKFRL